MQQFGIFAKYWRPGEVKTRLAASIGAQAASNLYRCFVETLLRRFGDVGDVRVLAYTPPDSREAFAELAGERWKLQPQDGNDLGERMADYFRAAFARGAERVVLIGSDSPDLPRRIIDQAFRYLQSHPVALGPAADGGYYLIGAARQTPAVFNDIDWSSSRVWAQTVALLRESNTEFAELPQWTDVDDEADLRRLHNELSAAPRADVDLMQAVERALSSLPRGIS